MHYLNEFLRSILNVSYLVRTLIVAAALILCLIVYMPHYNADYSASFFIVPIAIAAWLFPRREFFISMGITTLILIFFYSIVNSNGISWSAIFTTSSLVTAISLVVEGLLVGSLREQVILSDEAQIHVANLLAQQQQLSQIKDQFVLNVNHELRTPLTAVYGYLELLLEYSSQLDSATQTTFLKNAMYSCEELQLLVNNVLDTIQIGNEKDSIYLEELPVIDVIYEVVEHFDPREQQEYPMKVSVPEHLVVMANGQYFRQILRNLLSNAFKYAPGNAPISIEASLYGSVVQSNHPAPEVCISVRDLGPGIPPEDVPRLFGQFVRLKRDVSGNVRGTGLGLFVSKQLVEAMGGRIWVESTGIVGEGSCFRFTLPCVTRAKVKARTTHKIPEIPVIHLAESQQFPQDVLPS